MDNKLYKLSCRVCGKLQDAPPWGEDGKSPTYDICDCCGTEFGHGDCSLTAIQASRKRWLLTGVVWKYPEAEPIDWSLEEQMKIPQSSDKKFVLILEILMKISLTSTKQKTGYTEPFRPIEATLIIACTEEGSEVVLSLGHTSWEDMS